MLSLMGMSVRTPSRASASVGGRDEGVGVELTPGEIVRRFEELERRIASRVSRELYDRDLREIRDDLSEIRENIRQVKESMSWGMRLVVAQFLALIVGLIFFLLGQP
jgi:hypothetical protein